MENSRPYLCINMSRRTWSSVNIIRINRVFPNTIHSTVYTSIYLWDNSPFNSVWGAAYMILQIPSLTPGSGSRVLSGLSRVRYMLLFKYSKGKKKLTSDQPSQIWLSAARSRAPRVLGVQYGYRRWWLYTQYQNQFIRSLFHTISISSLKVPRFKRKIERRE